MSLAVLGFILLFLVGEGMPPISTLSMCFPFGVMFGLIVAWFFEGIGAAISIASVAAFYAVHYFCCGGIPAGPFFLISALPSAFFLVSRFLRKR